MTGKWTPGPWKADLFNGEVYLDDGDILPLIATVQCDATSDAQAAADCHLIAAAPDLYAALEALTMRDPSAPDNNQSLWDAAAAALAKARGETK